MADREEVDKECFDLQAFRAGSPQAFRIFFFKHYGEFFSFAGILLHDKNAARNMTVASFFLLWAKHADLESEKNIKAFLYTTIRDSCLHYLKHLQQAPGPQEYAAGLVHDARFTGSLPEELTQELLAFAGNSGAS